jgi:hypothetical protein
MFSASVKKSTESHKQKQAATGTAYYRYLNENIFKTLISPLNKMDYGEWHAALKCIRYNAGLTLLKQKNWETGVTGATCPNKINVLFQTRLLSVSRMIPEK